MTPEQHVAELRAAESALRTIREGLAEPFARVRALAGDDTWTCRRATAFRERLDQLEQRVVSHAPTGVAGGIESAEQLCALKADAIERELAASAVAPA